MPNIVRHGCIHVVCTYRVIKTPVLSHHFYHLLDILSCQFRDSRHVGRFTNTGTRREGNLSTNDQYPQVVSVCTVYASVTLKSYGRIATWSDPIRIRMVTDTDTDTWRQDNIIDWERFCNGYG